MRRWYKLNNVAKYFSLTSKTYVQKVFRISALLEEEIDETTLQEALNRTIEIFSNFNVNLKKGLFWYYFEETPKICEVTEENLPICFRLYNNSDDLLYRVSYFKNKINFEVSHILSDGRGSIEFFKRLITNYINLKYNLKIEPSKYNPSVKEKSEDSFAKYYKKEKTSKEKNKKIYNYKSKKLKNQIRYLDCHLDVKKVLDIAHEYNTTLTGFLVSLLIYSFKDEMSISDMHNKYIKIDVPVDLREYYKSYSTMNYLATTSVTYKFTSQEDSLKDVVREVNKQFKSNFEEDKISKNVNSLVYFEKNWFLKFVPLFIKNIAFDIIKRVVNDARSSNLSNIGIIKFENEVEKRVKSISIFTATDDFQLSLCTLKDDLSIGIASKYIDNDVIKNFLRFFSSKNIDIKVYGNVVEQ